MQVQGRKYSLRRKREGRGHGGGNTPINAPRHLLGLLEFQMRFCMSCQSGSHHARVDD